MLSLLVFKVYSIEWSGADDQPTPFSNLFEPTLNQVNIQSILFFLILENHIVFMACTNVDCVETVCRMIFLLRFYRRISMAMFSL